MKIAIATEGKKDIIKAAALIHMMERYNKEKSRKEVAIEHVVICCGKKEQKERAQALFKELNAGLPKCFIEIKAKKDAERLAEIMMAYEQMCMKEKPDFMMAIGDSDSALACAFTAHRFGIPVGHIEAGLRSFNKDTVEEINRVIIDSISEFLFTSCEDANMNLKNEGIPESKIFFVGNLIIDTLLRHIEVMRESMILKKLGLKKNVIHYAAATLSLSASMKDKVILKNIVKALERVAKNLPVILITHAQTVKQIKKANGNALWLRVEGMDEMDSAIKQNNIMMLSPVSYSDYLCLVSNAKLVLTDSGTVQEESTALGVPCITLREQTERGYRRDACSSS